jgi:hypothetical protein
MPKSNLSTDEAHKTQEIDEVRQRLIASELSVAEKGWVNTSQEVMLSTFRARTNENEDEKLLMESNK